MKPATPLAHAQTTAERARTRELAGEELAAALRAEAEPTGVNLAGADLGGADLSGLSLFKADLRGATLRGADLSSTELAGADLEGADLERARLVGAGLGMANLNRVNAFSADFSDATLTGSDLVGASLGCADLSGSRLREADLTGADLRAATLRDAELSLATVHGTCFDEADLRGARLRAVTGYEAATWYGVDIRDINFSGAYRLRRHIIDENYLREFRESSRARRWLFEAWRLTSDCGRSLGRWGVVIGLVAIVFAFLFSLAGLQTGIHEPGGWTFLYYSVVTLTTLGYGDIVPLTGVGQTLVMLEVAVGYVMLGGLISIFANKMARRGE